MASRKCTAVEAAYELAYKLRFNNFFQFCGTNAPKDTTVYVYVGYLPRGPRHIPKKVGRFPVVVRRINFQRLARISAPFCKCAQFAHTCKTGHQEE